MSVPNPNARRSTVAVILRVLSTCTHKTFCESCSYSSHAPRLGNKKLGVASRIIGHKLAEPVVNPMTGEIIAEAGEFINTDKGFEIEQAGVGAVYLDVEDKLVKVIGNQVGGSPGRSFL